MKIRIFQSDKGDCLLLTSAAGTRRVLVDGGMTASYLKHVAPNLAKSNGKGAARLDAVHVSHIDDDHIAGVLQLMNDLVHWRVFDFKMKTRKRGEKPPKKPENPRPPEVDRIWHNAFHELIKDNAGEIEDMLAASAAMLAASRKPVARALLAEQSGIALSKKQALQLARRTGPDQLSIPVNPEFKHKLMLLRKKSPELKIGGMEFVLIGPTDADLKKLREEWNEWLRENQKALADIRRKAKADEDRLRSHVDRVLAPITAQANEFAELQVALAKALGHRSKVSVPNLASLMFLVREGKQTILLTGDGHADDALKGLKRRGLLGSDGSLHVTAIKVPHHGSEHNMTPAFARSVTADHYIFCGNGFASNPELAVVNLIVKERRKALPQRAFTLWFNSTEALTQGKYKAHMRKLRKNVDAHVAAHQGKVKAKWIGGSFMDL